MGKRIEVKGWHSIAIEMVNEDASCSFEVLTSKAHIIIGALADPDVVALTWTFGSQKYMVMTSQIARVIVEPLEPAHLDDNHDRRELIETAGPTTASVMVRTRTQDKDGLWWSYLWPKDTP